MSHQQWKVEQLLTVETRTNLRFVSSVLFHFLLVAHWQWLKKHKLVTHYLKKPTSVAASQLVSNHR